MESFRVESTRRHTYRDGSLLRPALVRVSIDGPEMFIASLDAVQARDLAAKLLAAASRADAANRAGRIAHLRPADHEMRHDLADTEMCAP